MTKIEQKLVRIRENVDISSFTLTFVLLSTCQIERQEYWSTQYNTIVKY